MIESPDDLFKIGVDEIDYKALGLAELQGCAEGKYPCAPDQAGNSDHVNGHVVINDDVDLIKLKILSLNVCGLVSKLHNPDFVEFLSLYDIICLTETKIDKIDDVVFEGYELLPPICRS